MIYTLKDALDVTCHRGADGQESALRIRLICYMQYTFHVQKASLTKLLLHRLHLYKQRLSTTNYILIYLIIEMNVNKINKYIQINY